MKSGYRVLNSKCSPYAEFLLWQLDFSWGYDAKQEIKFWGLRDQKKYLSKKVKSVWQYHFNPLIPNCQSQQPLTQLLLQGTTSPEDSRAQEGREGKGRWCSKAERIMHSMGTKTAFEVLPLLPDNLHSHEYSITCLLLSLYAIRKKMDIYKCNRQCKTAECNWVKMCSNELSST